MKRNYVATIKINNELKTKRGDNVFNFIREIMASQGLYCKFKNKYNNYAIDFNDYKNRHIELVKIFYEDTGEVLYDNNLQEPFINKMIFTCFMRFLSGFSGVVSKNTN